MNHLRTYKTYKERFTQKLSAIFREERGDSNIIAIILIIIIVIALAIIFRDQLFGIVDKLFGKINTSIDGV